MSHGVRGGVRAARAEPRRDEVVRAWPRLSVVLVADLVATEGLLRRQQDADVGDKSASKKPRDCYAKLFPLRGALSARVTNSRSGSGGVTLGRYTRTTLPRSTISARQ